VRRLIKRAYGTLEQVAGEAISATRAASKGNAEDAADHTERAVREVLEWAEQTDCITEVRLFGTGAY
jgi:hypothetical protein